MAIQSPLRRDRGYLNRNLVPTSHTVTRTQANVSRHTALNTSSGPLVQTQNSYIVSTEVNDKLSIPDGVTPTLSIQQTQHINSWVVLVGY